MSSDSTSKIRLPVSFHIIGDAFVDLFCFLGGDWPEQGGDAQLSQPIEMFAGGSSVNTATHLNAILNSEEDLALHTVLNPADRHGKTLLAHAEKYGFSLLNCRAEDEDTATGHCVAIVSGQDRSFMTYRGCVDTFSPHQIGDEMIINSESHVHMHIAGYYNLSGFQNGNIVEKVNDIRNQRKASFPSKTTTISLVPQHDATKAWDSGIDEVIPCIDFLIMNDMEAMYIVRKGRMRRSDKVESQLPASCSEEDIKDFASYFGELSPKTCIVITRGASGAVALLNGKIFASQAAFKVDPIDPTGAGDSFAAGFMHGLWGWKRVYDSNNDTNISPWPKEALENALIWGCAMGTSSIRIRGASLPSEQSDIKHYYEQTVKLNAKY